MKKKKQSPIFYIISGVVLYILSAGLSYASFSLISKPKSVPTPSPKVTSGSTRKVIDPAIPRTEACPINGKMYTKQEKEVWEKRRPLAVMIENHPEARPQSGLGFADVVYEAVAEGGITRFMGIFYCGAAADELRLAPVRSARTYYIDWLSEYDALYNHVGGAGNCNDSTVNEKAKALCQIDRFGIKDMDQFFLPFKVCRRNENRIGKSVATEHTVECYANELYDYAKTKFGWTNVDEEGVAWDANFTPWKFKDDAKDADRGTTNSLTFVHWGGESYSNQFVVKWDYDKANNQYKRTMGGEPHIEWETKQQLTSKNVVIQFTRETDGVDEHGHVLYGTLEGGKMLLFQDGNVITGTWKKPTRTARTKFFDDKGKEISFNKGEIWIEVVGTDVKVTY